MSAFRSAVEQVFASPRAKQFASFDATYHAEVDTALARLLLGSPHLGEVRKFGYTFGHISEAARTAFIERFGKPVKGRAENHRRGRHRCPGSRRTSVPTPERWGGRCRSRRR